MPIFRREQEKKHSVRYVCKDEDAFSALIYVRKSWLKEVSTGDYPAELEIDVRPKT